MLIPTAPYHEQQIRITMGETSLAGDLRIPENPRGIVLFAHGSGSSRHSPRNRFVAAHLNDGHLVTLLIDLLTEHEEREEALTAHLRFNLDLLATRLVDAMRWLKNHRELRSLKIGLFGASTGGGAALVAAAREPHLVGAIVSRGGGPTWQASRS